MKGILISARWSLVTVLAFTATRVFAAPIVISSPEDWNGVLNPREADGVTLSGSGAPGDPAVYTIPDGLVIQSTGAIRLTPDINDVNDVALNEIDLHVENTSSEIQEDLAIAAAGQVRIKGMVNYSDTDSGGNLVRAVRIDAESIEVGGVDTRSLRNGPPGRASGDVVLRALSGSGNFDPSFAGNRFANRVAVNGPIRTDGNGAGGSVTIQGVVVQTGGLFEQGGRLEGSPTLSAGWGPLGTGGSWTEPLTEPARFYRVRW